MLEAILKKIAVLCDGKGISIALAGGFAYSLYCGPRATVDLDFVVLTDKDLDDFEGMLKRDFPSVYRNIETIRYPLVTINRFLLIEEDEETVLDLLIVNDAIRQVYPECPQVHNIEVIAGSVKIVTGRP